MMNKKFVLSFLCMTLIGCSPLQPNSNVAQSQKDNQNQQTVIALPPNYTTRPEGNQLSGSLQPSKGFKIDSPFSEELTDVDQRFERVENVVLGLKTGLDEMMPAIHRLIAIEGDIQDLVNQLDILFQEKDVAQPISVAPNIDAQPSLITPADTALPPPTTFVDASPVTINDIRFGQHAEKLRIVLDVSDDTPYTLDLNNDKRALTIELPSTKSALPVNRALNTPLPVSYSVEAINNGQGSRIIFALSGTTEIMKDAILAPHANGGYRIFVDLKS